MNISELDGVKSLITANQKFCVSVFLPTYQAGPDLQQNRINFKRLIHKAKTLLMEKEWKSSPAEDFLAPMRSVLWDEMFWQHPLEGLAFFLCPDFLLYYRLPIQLQEQVMVDERFLIRPLLPFLAVNRKFYVLAISENQLRLLKNTTSDLEEMPVKTVPHNLQEAIRFNDPERQLQLHTQTPRIPGARAAAIFHGHGIGIDDKKDDLREYCRQVDRGLHPLLKNERVPLVVAAVDSLFSIYARINTYPHLLEDAVYGNPELLPNTELRNRAGEIVDSYLAGKTQELLKHYDELAGTNLVSTNVEEIISAGRDGRVQHLLVNSNQPWWGRYFEETGRVESHETQQSGDTEIVNLALIETLKTGGKVHELKPICDRHPSLLAIYRYRG